MSWWVPGQLGQWQSFSIGVRIPDYEGICFRSGPSLVTASSMV